MFENIPRKLNGDRSSLAEDDFDFDSFDSPDGTRPAAMLAHSCCSSGMADFGAQKQRTKLLSKLAYHKIWKRQKTLRGGQTVVVFDWDDTFFPTSVMHPHNFFQGEDGIMNVPLDIYQQIQKLDRSVSRLLSRSLSLGPVYIITNAAEGWVELSAERFMPKTFKLLP